MDRDEAAALLPQSTVTLEIIVSGPAKTLTSMFGDGDDPSDALLDGFGFPFGVTAIGRVIEDRDVRLRRFRETNPISARIAEWLARKLP